MKQTSTTAGAGYGERVGFVRERHGDDLATRVFHGSVMVISKQDISRQDRQ
jgi:hypothetical protein